MTFRRVAVWLLVAAIGSMAPPVAGQGPLIPVEAEALGAVGSWLLKTIGGYAITKAIDPFVDKVLGRDNEKKIKAIEQRLQAQLNQGTANRAQVEEELAVARRELKILRQLMAGQTTQVQLEQYRQELATDMKTIQRTLVDHERRLADQERLLAAQGKILEQQGLELQNLKRHQQQPWSPREAPTSRPSGPVPLGHPYSSAADLKIEVKGQANYIRLREATHPVKMGRFQFSRSRSQAAYFLPPSTRAVVELFAPDNRISMPAGLANQVQIISHGWHYETLIY